MHSLSGRLLVWSASALLSLSSALASDYYVAPTGSDSAPGTLAQPFQTIQQAASVMVAGDTAYIRAGVYRETVTPANSGTQSAPITYMPYNGESVTVSGADLIPADWWTLSSGNIYQAPISWDLGNGANQVFLDGQMMIEARWPNTTLDFSHPTVATASGGSFVSSGPGGVGADGGVYNSTGTFTDFNLPKRPSGYWNGATIHMLLGAAWWWQTGTVVGSPAQSQLSFQFDLLDPPLVPSPGSSYYLTGELGELDSAGEWFLATSTLYFWTPATDSPAQHTVEAKRRQFAFDLSGLSFITIQGIGLFASTITSDANSMYLVLDGLTAQYLSQVSTDTGDATVPAQTTGILLQGANNVLRNSTLAWSAGNGVLINGNGHRVFNNTIHDTGYGSVAETESVKSAFAPSEGVIIGWNTIYNTSRSGIQTDPYAHNYFSAGRIIHNDIHDYGLQTNDLGCTYTWTSNGGGTEIAYNLCHDGHGLLLNNSYPWVAGIYLDDSTSNFVVHHNLVWNTSWGTNFKAASTGVYNNTFVGTIASVTGADNLPGTAIENNIFVGPIASNPMGTVMTNNILPGTDPQFVDPTNQNYQLLPTSPAIAAGLVIPPYTNGYSGSAPDIGAYDHTKPAWKAGAQNAATVSAPSYAPTLTPGTIAVITGSVPFDPGASVVFTEGANVDWPVSQVYVVASPPQLAFQVPAAAASGIAMITITNGDGTVSLSSAPLFAGTPAVSIAATQGSSQSAPVETLFGTLLQATVTAGGNPVDGASVTFAAPVSGASGSFALSATVSTNGSGVATAPAFIANAVAGPFTVTASAAGVGALAVFNLINSGGGASLLSQTITFGPLANQTLGSSPPPLSATASSGLGVTFVSNITSICTVSGVNVTLVGEGTCSITASQPGSATFSAALPLTQSFTVTTSSLTAFSEIGIFRAPPGGSGGFLLDLNQSTYNIDSSAQFLSFGSPGDQPVAGDWTGTGVISFGVFRQGVWYIDLNNNGVWDGVAGGDAIYNFGQPGDIAIPGDWNGTGVTKLGVFRCPIAPAAGNCTWYLDAGNKKTFDPATAEVYTYGQTGDLPVVNNWNGTGTADQIGVFRCTQAPAIGPCSWIVENVGDGVYRSSDPVYVYGQTGDLPVVGNWTTGPQRKRIGVFRQGTFFVTVQLVEAVLSRDGTGSALRWDRRAVTR